MRGLTRRLHEEERGAYVAAVAALFAVILAALALSIDTGILYQERHELQNAADAGAIAVAFNCARGGPCNPEDADALANANASDSLADVESVVISGSEVTVTTRSLAADGSNSVSLAAARVFGMDSALVRARATATISLVGAGITIPLAMCSDVWDYATAGGTDLPTGQILVRYDPSEQHIEPEERCDTYPGGFGFLQAAADCSAYYEAGEPFQGTPGNTFEQSASNPCSTSDLLARLRAIIDGTDPNFPDSIVLVPIFAPPGIGNGASGAYNILGFGAFRLDGFFLNIAGVPSPQRRYQVTNAECSPPVSCLKGAFTAFVPLNAVADDSAADFGTLTVRLTR